MAIVSRYLVITVAVVVLASYFYSGIPTYPKHFTLAEKFAFYFVGVLIEDTPWKDALVWLGLASSQVNISRSLFAATVRAVKLVESLDENLYRDSKVAGVPVRVFKSTNGIGGGKKSSIVIFFHGGGFHSCDPETHHFVCEYIVLNTDATVISVDYRLAPENVFPAALEDAYAVTKAVMEDPNVNRSQVSLAGDSAGGNLVMAVIVKWRAEGMEKRIGKFSSQILIYPLLQMIYFNTGSYMKYKNKEVSITTTAVHTSVSYYAIGSKKLISTLSSGAAVSCQNMNRIVRDLWGLALSYDDLKQCPNEMTEFEDILTNPLFSPLATENVKDFPPALIVTAEFDVLRDDGVIYANRLREADVPVDILNANTSHGYINLVKGPLPISAAVQSMEKIVNFLNTINE